jgi:hypothetical protein
MPPAKLAELLIKILLMISILKIKSSDIAINIPPELS